MIWLPFLVAEILGLDALSSWAPQNTDVTSTNSGNNQVISSILLV